MILFDLSYGNATATEALWIVIGAVGLWPTYKNVLDSKVYVRGLDTLSAENDEGFTPEALARMRIIAFGYYRNELLRVVKLSVIVMIGVTSALAPPPAADIGVTAAQLIVTLGISTITSVMVVQSFLDKRQRELLLEMKE